MFSLENMMKLLKYLKISSPFTKVSSIKYSQIESPVGYEEKVSFCPLCSQFDISSVKISQSV
jgi:hypothetical protein